MGLLSKRADKRIAAYQRELIDIHYREVDTMYRKMRGWRHDYRNHISVMKNLYRQGSLEELGEYLDMLESDLSTVDTLGGGDEGYKWYITRPWSADRLTPYDYKTENGILTLMSENPTYGIAFNSVDVATNNGFRYKQGYLEVRLRIVRPSPNDSHESGVPTVWSFTEDKALEAITGNDTHWVELDWLEYWGNTNQYPGGYYTTTFHQSTTVAESPSYSNSNHSLEALGDAEWHVMGWLGEDNKIKDH